MNWKGIALLTATSTQIVKSHNSFSFFPRATSTCFLGHKIGRRRSDQNQLKGQSRSASKRDHYQTQGLNMPRGVKKENLPSKICVVCGRPFTWRKKWERVWDEVSTCSKSCNHKRRVTNRQLAKNESISDGLDHPENMGDPLPLRPDATSTKDLRLEESTSSYPLSISLRSSEELGASLQEPSEEDLIKDQNSIDGPVTLAKKQRKALKKAKKAERRAQREGRGDPTAGQKQCDMCGKSVDLLIRCLYEEGQSDWKMVCGKCWNIASGGVVDGDENHPHYKYGGLWKNRRAQR